MTGGTSEFGVQYDSLCDLVSFGLAPAFLMYQGGLNTLGRFGWVVCFLFLACGALRLARFNVQSSIGKASGDFTGLPIPMAAGVIACFVSLTTDLKDPAFDSAVLTWITDFITRRETRIVFFAVAGFGLALAMVSNITYRSHKAIKLTGFKPFKILVGFVILTGLVAFRPASLGFLFFQLYALSGPFEWLLGWKKPVEDDEIFSTGGEEDDNHGVHE
jgi:CDP-diacylglycerol--serine O-phosphatidyltransferase